jgi:hypothetical protein
MNWITLLWMLYLAFMILITTATIRDQIRVFEIKQERGPKLASFQLLILTCLLWSIWYFYYLH